jgi:penicillin amidase
MGYWEWGKIHTLRLTHSLGRIEFLRPALTIGPVPAPGDGVTVNMGFYRHSSSFEHTVGPSLRFIVDVGHWEQSGFILSSGQSGHLFSPHYQDQTSLWRNGRTIRIHLGASELASAGRLVLNPAISPLS